MLCASHAVYKMRLEVSRWWKNLAKDGVMFGISILWVVTSDHVLVSHFCCYITTSIN